MLAPNGEKKKKDEINQQMASFCSLETTLNHIWFVYHDDFATAYSIYESIVETTMLYDKLHQLNEIVKRKITR